MITPLLAVVLGTFYIFISAALGSPILPDPQPPAFPLTPPLNQSLPTNLTRPSPLSSALRPSCTPVVGGYNTISTDSCRYALRYLFNTRPHLRRVFDHAHDSYTYPPRTVSSSECSIVVYTMDPGRMEVFDFYDIYLDAQAVLDECNPAIGGAKRGSMTGRVQMLDRDGKKPNGFWVEVRAKRRPIE